MGRLSVHRSLNHIYVQLIAANEAQVLAVASTVEKEIRGQVKHGGNVQAATLVGKLIAERARQAGVTNVAFDRSG